MKAEEELELLEIYLKRKVQIEPVKAKKQSNIILIIVHH